MPEAIVSAESMEAPTVRSGRFTGFDHTGVTPAKHQNNAASDILTGWHEGMWV